MIDRASEFDKYDDDGDNRDRLERGERGREKFCGGGEFGMASFVVQLYGNDGRRHLQQRRWWFGKVRVRSTTAAHDPAAATKVCDEACSTVTTNISLEYDVADLTQSITGKPRIKPEKPNLKIHVACELAVNIACEKSSRFADLGVARDQLRELLPLALRIHPNGVAIHVIGDNAGVHSDDIIADDKMKIDWGERRLGRSIFEIFDS
ncbi:hypothetical protein TIFTF001_027557 [Ficus carica]|uniref:Uncharacterized protein n=1 Tax=Ficus carica TaxID=3494 RepID=A0AA88IVB1_FICCA|nr:hypothetical protein TIFTF001_027557 [Ficus carica]